MAIEPSGPSAKSITQLTTANGQLTVVGVGQHLPRGGMRCPFVLLCFLCSVPAPVYLSLLPRKLHTILQQFLVPLGIDIVLCADILLQTRTFTQHKSRSQRPRLGEDVWI